MEWLTWFGRWSERDRAYARLKKVKEEYGAYGDRVIRLSARTDLARKSAGSTQRAFDFVERAFADATQEYARFGDLVQAAEAGLAKGKVADFLGMETTLKGLGPKMDELDRHLTAWESKWQQIPLQLDDVARSLESLRLQVESAVAAVGAPLPLSDRMASLTQHLERTRQVLAEGNPIEAGHLIEDLRMAMQRVSGDVGLYVSGAGAITQAEREVTEHRERVQAMPGGAPADAVAALGAAEALLARLRPSLAAGRLEHFQADLLKIQESLATVRSCCQ
ncbi:MAG TPA: hypothetical protein VD902_04585 [Symbiobacteriaceae bacterium]|nr:hypothetical protein [Symbiobacteriaceae bacterium]